jgi:hypothetical protein
MKRKIGVGLIVLAYALFLYIALSAPAYAHAHPHLDAHMLAAYAAPWPVALAGSLGLVGIVLALIPIRRGENWAILTSFATLRFYSSPAWPPTRAASSFSILTSTAATLL